MRVVRAVSPSSLHFSRCSEEASGLGNKLVNLTYAFVGRTKGGLGAATLVACAIFGADQVQALPPLRLLAQW